MLITFLKCKIYKVMFIRDKKKSNNKVSKIIKTKIN